MSKNTKYFDTIEEARQYFPDGVPSNVIAIVGDGSQVLVSSDNAVNANQQYYNADLTNDEIVNTMVQDSYDEGHSDGYAEGYDEGYTEGEAAGGGSDLEDNYFWINPSQPINNFKFYLSDSTDTSIDISYSFDKINWTDITVYTNQHGNSNISVSSKIYVKGYNSTLKSLHFNCQTNFNVGGNILSLFYGEYYSKFLNVPTPYIGSFLSHQQKLVDASELILSANLSVGCYQSMFSGCTLLTAIPLLPATTLTDSCYNEMFQGCTSLTTAPILPATTLVNGCYANMFVNCTSLNTITCLATQYNESGANECFGENPFETIAQTGTFYKNQNTDISFFDNNWSGEGSIIPSGWTIQDYVAA